MTNKKEKNNELMIYDKQSLQAVDQIRKAITKKHKSV